MKKLTGYIIFIVAILSWMMSTQSCTHMPSVDMDPDMTDTTDNPIDTTMTDTTDVTPCDPDVIYFKRDILPIFRGSCAIVGCHDAVTAEQGVILDSYENVMNTGDIDPFDLSGSDVYEMITEEDDDDVMPPTGRLSNDKINLIAKWILQGALDLECDDTSECTTENMSYSNDIAPILTTYCIGCHRSSVANGGVIIDNYSSVREIALNGRLYGAISWESGYINMPFNQEKLSECNISKIKAWIDEGAQNN